eukprot:scaffold694_cov338-Pavlova_lutheri.AAC.25
MPQWKSCVSKSYGSGGNGPRDHRQLAGQWQPLWMRIHRGSQDMAELQWYHKTRSKRDWLDQALAEQRWILLAM